jgi:MaoC like domain
MGVIRYDRDDLRLFSTASHDWSRLHTSDEYARQTSYGEVIVFGILGAFASLGELRDRPGMELAKVSLTYRSALYMNVDYRATVNEKSDVRAGVVLLDGAGSPMMSSDFRFREASSPTRADEVAGVCPVSEQADWKPEDLVEGVEVAGRYAPDPTALGRIIERWHLLAKGATPPQVANLLWSSYLTGMHLPGLAGTSAQLQLTYRLGGPPPRIPFDYRSRVVGFDDRFRLLHSSTELSSDEGIFADAEVWSRVRDDEAPSDSSGGQEPG